MRQGNKNGDHYTCWHEGRRIIQPGSLTIGSKTLRYKSNSSCLRLSTGLPWDKVEHKQGGFAAPL